MDEENYSVLHNILLLTAKYRDDFVTWAKSICHIKDNRTNIVPFELNPIQVKLHEAIEEQLRTTGKVRVVILKSRKLGMSTYSAARFTHKLLFNKNSRAVVIAHIADASNTLYGIYQRIYNYIPDCFRPSTTKDNAKELVFEGIDSSLKVATAGSSSTGRGDTVNYLHCSEIAYWPRADEVSAGLMEAVPNVDGSEIIIESTSNGIGDVFHRYWVEAVNGKNGYLPLFFGWNEDPSLVKPLDDYFELSTEEKEYQRLWELSDEQMYWRQEKIAQKGEDLFRQEFPISAEEAFRNTTKDSFITNDPVLRARKNKDVQIAPNTPLILGVDVARSGDDSTCIVWRRGKVIEKFQKYQKLKGDEVAYRLVDIIKKDNPARIFIDATGGFGGAVHDSLRILGYDSTEVHFSSKPIDDQYGNKRAEIYGELKAWLGDGYGVKLPDNDEIESDLTSFGYKFRGEKIYLEDKGEVKKRIKRSPDIGDAIALTFAEPLGPYLASSPNSGNWSKVRNRKAMYQW